MRPLDRLPSIKLKLGVAIVVAVGVSAVVSTVGFRLGVPLWARPLISVALALGIVQVLARGMTSPLREMADAAVAMARGEHGRRVTATSADEVGALGRAFNAMAAELEQLDALRRGLLATVSHELRTPLGALQANLENFVDGVEEPSPERLATMLRQVERLGRLVSQLLDLSRLEAGMVPLDPRPLEVRRLLDEVADACRLAYPDVPLGIAVMPPTLRVHADPERLHQALANLVENAARHSPAGAGVELSASAEPGGCVRLEVADRGPGLPDGAGARVFEPFVSGGGGAGLGLAIARWVADLHGGAIRAQAVDPHGCRMVLELPGPHARKDAP